jgi:hypothetical protein
MPRQHLAELATWRPHPESISTLAAVKQSNRPCIPNTTLYTHDSVLSSTDTESNNLMAN